jgi:hypothetical protein
MRFGICFAALLTVVGSFVAGGWAGNGAAIFGDGPEVSDRIHLDMKAVDDERTKTTADRCLADMPVTITASFSPRSQGGRHDFFSEGDYWWPDPKNPAAPYVQRDGMTNPENFVEHRKALMGMSVRVAMLTAAYRITGARKYADAAMKHLLAWFVDPDSKMNPNLEYAQAIHGRFKGRGTGIIDTIHLIEPARAVTILEKAGLLKGEELAGVKRWFRDYIVWLVTSKNGQDEMKATNNHGTCFVMQLAEFAGVVEDEKTLEFCRKRFKEVLLPTQMGADGSFPAEMRRTKPYSYSMFNLDAMCTVCEICSTPADNLWAYMTPDGRNMKKAEGFMYPFIKDKSAWPKPPDVMFWDKWPVRSPSLLFAGRAYNVQRFIDLWVSLPADYSNEEVMRNVPIRTPLLWVD